MKSNILLLSIALLLGTFLSCDDSTETPQSSENILPTKFSVSIPESITRNSTGGRTNGRVMEDDFNGNEIYDLLSIFISIGEEASNIVESIIGSIGEFGINQPMIISFEGDDDQRIKNLEVIKNATYEGVNYEFRMTITDADSEDNTDGGVAMQIFWNTNPVKGVALMKPYNMDRTGEVWAGEAIFRIDYSETGEFGYDAHMIVSIIDLPTLNPTEDPFAIDNLKMFVGKTGDIVDVYGNSNHPNATLFTSEMGFNWAFVASGIDNADIAVTEVGLPPNTLDATTRTEILEDYSIKQVFTNLILAEYPNADPALIGQLLVNTEAPAFFGVNGFIQGGTSPGEEYDPLVIRINNLTPYNPNDINNLTINFQ
jgi:hypothetical protein